jgi:class 3 adenylate cyclase
MFTDVVGSTALLEQLGDRAGTELLRRHFAALRRAVASHGGREVKMLGDGLMVVFADPSSAAACAAAMQRSIARHNRVVGNTRLGLRIGLHSGEALQESGDYFGMPVVIAKRLCDLCVAGEVIVSSAVRELSGGDDRHFGELRTMSLKGISTPVKASMLRWTESALRAVSATERSGRLAAAAV